MATMVDNLSVDSDTGEVYAAGMPSLRHAFSQDTRDKGTSQVRFCLFLNLGLKEVYRGYLCGWKMYSGFKWII